MDNTISDFDIEKFELFFTILKRTYKLICHSEMIFKPFAMEATERMYGVEKLMGPETQSFDGKPAEEIIPEKLSFEDDAEYEKQFRKWIGKRDEAARNYLYTSFNQSPILERLQIETLHDSGGKSFHYHNYRKSHQYFENKLLNPEEDIQYKINIIELFIICRSGDPGILAELLLRTFPTDCKNRIS